MRYIRTAFVFTVALLAAQTLSAQGIYIQGIVQPVPSTLVLNRIQPQGTQTLATLTCGPDGSFNYFIEQGSSGFYQLWNTKQNFTVLVLHPGDSINLVLDGNSLGIPISIKGSHDTELSRQIIMQGRRMKSVRDSLQKVYTEYVYTPQRDSITSVLMVQYSQNDLEFRDLLRKTVADNPGSMALYFYTEYLDKNIDIEYQELILNSLLTKYSSDFFVQSLRSQVEVGKITAIGKEAPEIRLPTPQGDTLALSSLRGNYVLIDFWAAWCGPCRRENPKLLAVYRKYHDLGFQIYGVSLDKDRNAWLKAIETDSLPWSQVSDLMYWSSVASRAYGVSSIPASFLLDPEGRIIAKGLRSEQLEEQLKQIYNTSQ